ncbi:hypothetical protein KUV50_10860 [Membranicola marinus]|uniref:Uncharacterized protein n=1 Tax=Membranihabitans marinus TaxID=1227546 RepID=A0A953HXU6_9BACT|nr:hypothetical protein [Membranihabitans marinus]MBY5958636.1 hypothetical protein [Membranihabitans marinus]
MRSIFTLFLFASILCGCQDTDQQEEESTTPSAIELDQSVEDLTDRIQIKTIQIGSETTTDKNKFHTSYPYTEYEFINTHQEEYAYYIMESGPHGLERSPRRNGSRKNERGQSKRNSFGS